MTATRNRSSILKPQYGIERKRESKFIYVQVYAGAGFYWKALQ